MIDAENQSPKNFTKAKTLLCEIGNVHICRAYADWEKNEQKAWDLFIKNNMIEKRLLLKRSRKNAADITLIREASQLIQKGEIDAIAIYSGDGDYKMAIEAWKGQDILIIVFQKKGVSNHLIENADIIINEENGEIIKVIEATKTQLQKNIISRIRYEILPCLKIIGKIELPVSGKMKRTAPESDLAKLIKLLIDKVIARGGKILVSDLGAIIKSEYPSFRPTSYQCKKLTGFLRKYIPDINIYLASDQFTYWAEIKK